MVTFINGNIITPTMDKDLERYGYLMKKPWAERTNDEDLELKELESKLNERLENYNDKEANDGITTASNGLTCETPLKQQIKQLKEDYNFCYYKYTESQSIIIEKNNEIQSLKRELPILQEQYDIELKQRKYLESELEKKDGLIDILYGENLEFQKKNEKLNKVIDEIREKVITDWYDHIMCWLKDNEKHEDVKVYSIYDYYKNLRTIFTELKSILSSLEVEK